MNGVVLLLIAAVAFLGGYFLYARKIEKVLGIDPKRDTPAHTRKDGIDFIPAHPTVLFGHHFAAIAGAGPIVGPVLAAEFGWTSVALWIILGCIFIGAAHDMISLFLSIRHQGESIGTVIGTILGKPGKILFLLFSWSALILVLSEFTRQIAATFVADPAIATASLLFIAEAIVFGLCVNKFKLSVLWMSLIFVPLMFAFVWIGNVFPLDLMALFGLTKETTTVVWTVVLLVYCFFAATCPVWILLQPRDYLNAYLLYAMMGLGFLGVFIAHPTLQLEAFTGFTGEGRFGEQLLFPLLFVTVACGACSGFHALVASGTTAKQLGNERSVRPVAYGGMLLEGVLAIIALIGVAGAFASQQEYVGAIKTMEPVQMFASTVAGMCTKFCNQRLAESFMLLSVSAFLMTSVDAGTRLARFCWQELVGSPVKSDARCTMHGALSNMYVGTLIVVLLAAALLLGASDTSKQLWTIFASANQLLAALTLLAATLWFIRNKKPAWFTGIPMVFMMIVSSCALGTLFYKSFFGAKIDWVKGGATGFLLTLAVILIVFAIRATKRKI